MFGIEKIKEEVSLINEKIEKANENLPIMLNSIFEVIQATKVDIVLEIMKIHKKLDNLISVISEISKKEDSKMIKKKKIKKIKEEEK